MGLVGCSEDPAVKELADLKQELASEINKTKGNLINVTIVLNEERVINSVFFFEELKSFNFEKDGLRISAFLNDYGKCFFVIYRLDNHRYLHNEKILVEKAKLSLLVLRKIQERVPAEGTDKKKETETQPELATTKTVV